MYDVGAPDCDANTTSLPWNQLFEPTGELLFCVNHPAPGSAVTLSKPCVNGGQAGVGVGVGPPPQLPVVRLSDQPPANDPLSPETRSTTYKLQVPFGLVPPKTEAKVALVPPAGPGWL